MSEQLPKEVSNVIEKWLGSMNLLYVWEDEGTYYVVAWSDMLYFLRLFRIGGEYVISQDHECEVPQEVFA